MSNELTTHVNEDGTFGEGFVGAAKEAAGEGFAESKVFDDVKDFATLVKNYANTKKSVGEKLDNVIQKPGEDASDEDKATYHTTLLKELGAPDSIEGYEFTKPEDLPKGMTYNEDFEKTFKEIFLANNVPADTAATMAEAFNVFQIAGHNARVKAENDAFAADSEKLGKDWSGDKMKENPRVAFKAIMEFAEDDLKAKLKESKIYATPDDLSKWRELGITIGDLRMAHKIGTVMKSGESPGDETQGGGVAKTEGSGLKYDHPDSLAQRKAETASKE